VAVFSAHFLRLYSRTDLVHDGCSSFSFGLDFAFDLVRMGSGEGDRFGRRAIINGTA
jgi:hypothetical protein